MKKLILKFIAAVCAFTLCFAMFFACSSQSASNNATPPATEEGSDGTETGETEQTLRQKYSAACAAVMDDFCSLQISASSSLAVTFAVIASAEPEHQPAKETDLYTVRGVSAFIGMLGEMLNDSSFLLTDKAVKFTASYENGNYSENFSAVLAYSFDQQNKKIVMSWDVDSVSNGNATDIFLYMNIDYDFDTASLLGFHIKSVQTGEQNPNSYKLSYKYDGNSLTTWSSIQNDYASYFEPEQTALAALLPDAIDLNADYTDAYTAAMNRVNSAA